MHQNFINWAKEQLGGAATVTKSPYGDQGIVYQLDAPRATYFLKIASSLEKERDRLRWLDEKLPIPKVIGFTHIDGKDALLLSAIPGKNL